MSHVTETSDVVDIRIDRPAQGGESIGLLDNGRIVLVRGAIPGETVRARLDDPAAKLLRGQATEILEPSEHRRTPTCEAAAAGAGCCDWDYVEPTHAAYLKSAVVLDALRRIGRFSAADIPEPTITPLAPADHWRTRVRLGVDGEGRAGIRRKASRDLVVGLPCAQVAEGLTDGLAEEGTCPPGGELHVVRDADGQRHVLHRSAPERGIRGRKKKRPVATVIEGSSAALEKVNDYTFTVPVDGFWQAHENAAAMYFERVTGWLGGGTGVSWDLYGGVGSLAAALSASRPGSTVISVEAAPDAAEAGSKALAGTSVEFRTGRVEKVIGSLESPEVVVLDPPRSGAGAESVNAIAAAGPQKVLHIGCDPATFARDSAQWIENGYRLEKLEVIDAFPGTHHSETLGLFVRA